MQKVEYEFFDNGTVRVKKRDASEISKTDEAKGGSESKRRSKLRRRELKKKREVSTLP